MAWVWVSQQGSGPTSNPDVLLKEIRRLKDYFAAHGIDLTRVGISLELWWVSQALVELGFDKQVLAAKATLQLRNGSGAANLGQRKSSAVLKSGWGYTCQAERLCGANPTLGRIVVILFDYPRSKTFGVICPARPLRTCEALHLWATHSAVGTFWKRLKHCDLYG